MTKRLHDMCIREKNNDGNHSYLTIPIVFCLLKNEGLYMPCKNVRNFVVKTRDAQMCFMHFKKVTKYISELDYQIEICLKSIIIFVYNSSLYE